MRRSIAISQVLLLLTFYVVPLFASSSIAVPACCRRYGVHRCAMQGQSVDHPTAFSNAVHCPYRFPAVVLTHGTKLLLHATSIASVLPGSREFLLSKNPGYRQAQLIADLDNRGPPLTL